MEFISMDRIEEMEERCGKRVDEFVRHVRLAQIDEEDNAAKLSAMAEELGFPPAEFSSFVRAKRYALTRGTSLDDIAPLDIMAEQVGLSPEDFFHWLSEEADRHAEEWQKYLEDLQEEAGQDCD